MREVCVICGTTIQHEVDNEEAMKEMVDGHDIFGSGGGIEFMWGWCGCQGKFETVYKDLKIESSFMMKMNAVPQLRERIMDDIIINNYTATPVMLTFSVRMPLHNNWKEILQINVPPGHVYQTQKTASLTFGRGVGNEVKVDVLRDQTSYAIKGAGYGLTGGEANTTSTGSYMGYYHDPGNLVNQSADQIAMKVIYHDSPISYLVAKYNLRHGVK